MNKYFTGRCFETVSIWFLLTLSPLVLAPTDDSCLRQWSLSFFQLCNSFSVCWLGFSSLGELRLPEERFVSSFPEWPACGSTRCRDVARTPLAGHSSGLDLPWSPGFSHSQVMVSFFYTQWQTCTCTVALLLVNLLRYEDLLNHTDSLLPMLLLLKLC